MAEKRDAQKRVIITRPGVGVVGTVDLEELGISLDDAEKRPEQALAVIEKKHPTPTQFESKIQFRPTPAGIPEMIIIQVTKERWGF